MVAGRVFGKQTDGEDFRGVVVIAGVVVAIVFVACFFVVDARVGSCGLNVSMLHYLLDLVGVCCCFVIFLGFV